ncbi:methyltransferase domain-containing protein [Pontibacter sp. KCTC 32443]|uniref:class I SAM-dependent methyltransferase n=1 Tax=Pontibacter TaxID=323449 RepID=UPI00164E7C85|nr:MULTISPECIES: methyltransferase domain-containing protein [Pontibacter]MBC5772984.1 methyltransferase domain-containing protein [Pontibacter sp. KCTC 32443]
MAKPLTAPGTTMGTTSGSSLKKLVYIPIKRWLLLHLRLDTSYFKKQSDRIWLDKQLFPRLSNIKAGRILFVGCAFYTWESLKYFSKGVDLVTVDIDENNVIWGGKQHLVASILDIDKHVEASSFDIVLLNGVFGHGVNTPDMQAQTYKALHTILKPDGLLLVGWNSDISEDPMELETRKELFYRTEYEGLPQRTSFKDSTHVIDFLRKKV